MKYKVFAGLLLFQILLLALLAGHGLLARGRMRPTLAANRELARILQLTDLAIWTEARYTRHPSQTDFFSAFQDFPACMEHFPAGAVVSPPAFLKQGKEASGGH
ncbi:MAG: hypothetical protein ACOZBW_03140 [Thermodesulfobacteriota bacterium]